MNNYMRTSAAAVLTVVALFCFSACTVVNDLLGREDDDQGIELLAAATIAGAAGPVVLGEEYSGGFTTRFDVTVNAFDLPATNLTDIDRLIKFLSGNTIFNINWATAPSAAFDGLGPVHNRASCRGCHVRDGRGRPPLATETNFNSMLFRLSKTGQTDPTTGGPVGLDNYGDQLQDKAVVGITAEGSVTLTWTENPGTFPDGEPYSLRTPNYVFSWNFGTPTGYDFSPRTAPMVFGLGLLMAIPESTILGFADPNDADGDGISGKANMVWDVQTNSARLGRFGWKANNPNLTQQNNGAFIGDMGITNFLFSSQNCAGTQTACASAPAGNTPNPFEVSVENSDKVDQYTHLLAVPGRRDWTDATVLRGKELFNQIGCAKCHIPQIVTGELDGFPEVSNQTIYPYTDMLLHDMGPDLADGRPDFLATGREWRTPPLWGIGLIEIVNGHDNLMHDGRARGFKEAILWHGGEGEASREAFKNLERSDREAIVTFLRSL